MGNQQSFFDTLIHSHNHHPYRKTHSHSYSNGSSNFQSAFHYSSNSRHHNPKDCCALWKAIKSILGIWTTGNNEIDEIIKETQRNASKHRKPWKWIPFERFENVNFLAQGGYGRVYSAWCTDKDVYGRVALKVLNFSEHISTEYLQKLRMQTKFEHSGLIRIYGLTRDPQTNNYMLVMKYAKCNLRQYINKYYSTLSLSNKIELLVPISHGLKKIHQSDLIHGNFHPGNILQTLINNPTEKNFSSTNSTKIYSTPQSWSCISDLGLSGPASEELNEPKQYFSEKNGFVEEPAEELDPFITKDLNVMVDEYLFQEKQKDYLSTSKRRDSTYEKPKVYGVLPYIAPEVLRGQRYTQAADVYAFGFIIYEVFMGHPPYYDVPHDLKLAQNICKGHRPKITSSDIPHRVMKLISSCWESRPEYRPTAQELHNTIRGWYWRLDPEMKSLMRADDEAFRGIRSVTPVSGCSTPTTPGTPISPCYPPNPFTSSFDSSISDSVIYSPSKDSTMSTISSWNENGSYKIHPEAVYTSRLLEYENLPTSSWY